RHPENPILVPGLYDWRLATVFNPGVLLDDDGRFYLYERAAGNLRPFCCSIGMLASDDGVHFTHVSDQPVFTPERAGSKYGSVQAPRLAILPSPPALRATPSPGAAGEGVAVDEGSPGAAEEGAMRYYMTFAYRPYAWSSHPTGVGVPESHET